MSPFFPADVHPKIAQALARHSTITLTMDRYTHVGLFDQTAALDKLPQLPTAGPEAQAVRDRDGRAGISDKKDRKASAP